MRSECFFSHNKNVAKTKKWHKVFTLFCTNDRIVSAKKKTASDDHIFSSQYVQDAETQLNSLRALVEEADREKAQLQQELDDERRKVEDLQFRCEEGEINKEDLEVRNGATTNSK